MPSVGAMIKRLSGLQQTRDLTEWEDRFVSSVRARTHEGDDTSRLTGPQVEAIEQLFRKHFGD